jgi:hypothetical protein
MYYKAPKRRKRSREESRKYQSRVNYVGILGGTVIMGAGGINPAIGTMGLGISGGMLALEVYEQRRYERGKKQRK